MGVQSPDRTRPTRITLYTLIPTTLPDSPHVHDPSNVIPIFLLLRLGAHRGPAESRAEATERYLDRENHHWNRNTDRRATFHTMEPEKERHRLHHQGCAD